jgi:hypothetical protein
MERDAEVEIRFRGIPILTVVYIFAVIVMYFDLVYWRP